ncbi:MAG: class I SAM-dependent methyltransferase [Fuerstiella sp.]
MLPRTLEPEVMDTVAEATDYDRMDHQSVNQAFVDDLLRLVGSAARPSARENALHCADLGTGTALIPLELMARPVHFASIIACDLSLEMLKLARQHLRGTPWEQTVLPVFGDAGKLPLADKSCDVVMSNSIVHHIPDPICVFHEMRRIIRPAGFLFIRDLMRPSTASDVEHIVQTYAADENAHQQQMFRQSLHAALTVDEVAAMLAESGFSAQMVAATSDRHWTVAGRG